MTQTLIRPLKIHVLKIVELLELTTLLLEKVYTPANAQAVGLGKPYHDLVALAAQYAGTLKRNPAYIETESLRKYANELRLLFGLLTKNLQVAGVINDAAKSETVKIVAYVAEPHLKRRNRVAMLELLGRAEELCQALQAADIAPKVAELNLTGLVTTIRQLMEQCNRLIETRGEEKERRKKLGRPSNIRLALQKQLRFIFSVVTTLHYSATDATVRSKLVEMIDHTNATLDAFRHLTG